MITSSKKLTKRVRMKLRHYGSERFDPQIFKGIKDKRWTKPDGGLWTSPIDSEYGWKDWCTAEGFGLRRFDKHFDIDFEGDVLIINSIADLKKLPWSEICDYRFPLFEPLLKMGVDAIHLTATGQCKTRLSYPRNLYGWDCESVLILHKECLGK